MSAGTIDFGHGITAIDTGFFRPQFDASHLIVENGRAAFIDVGTNYSIPRLLDALKVKNIDVDSVEWVILTHVHLDHAGGAGLAMQNFPNAKLVVHPRGARHMIDPSALIAGATAVYGEDVMRATYGEILPVPESRVIVADVAAGRDFELQPGDRRLLFIDAPGHAKHHYAIWDAASRGWFSGDVFGLSYREFDQTGRNYIIPTTSPVQFDPAAWETTLARILAPGPGHVYLTHYSRVDAVAKLADDLRAGLVAYQRIARAYAAAPDRHARLYAGLMDFHLGQLRELGNPLSEARARELLDMDMEINAQGLEVWLDRETGTSRH